MTPADLTNDILIRLGGADIFNQALRAVNRGEVLSAAWDEKEHVISGKIARDGWAMPVSFELLDDGTVRSHCPCYTNRERGMICVHVVAIAIYMMVSFMPQEAPEEEKREAEREHPRVPPDARTVADVPTIHVKVFGSRAAVSVETYAHYGNVEVLCGGGESDADICYPDAEDPELYHVRNPIFEEASLKRLRDWHFEPNDRGIRWVIHDPRRALNFLGSGLPALRRHGWRLTLSARLEAEMDNLPSVVPVVTVRDAPNAQFEVEYSFDSGTGDVLPPAMVQAAILRGDSYVMTERGTILLDAEAVQQMADVFADCKSCEGSRPGSFRMDAVYAPYVRASLEAFDGIDLDDTRAPYWREVAAKRNRDRNARFEPVALGALENVLRPYQKEGVYWMRFLEKSALCGLLADEMGLGKTLQTLTWLSLERIDPEARGKPALIVCPTSLVRNWEAEAAKFVPSLKVLVISGPNRAAAFRRIGTADLVITSYALLQRDFEDAWEGRSFSVVVLDEAQHIKNRQTRNAKAVKGLKADHRLVLTGTPVENSVADVWSVFDFLMPDYLGDYDSFKALVQDPIAAGGAAAETAAAKLKRKLHPFILRRLKKSVAKDLPDKVIKTLYAPMSDAQQRLTNEYVMMARAKRYASKFEMLAVLMRLRQIANHPGLIREAGRPAAGSCPENVSGKLEAFFEFFDEAVVAGHRMLVFSQFVGMLTILRQALEARGVTYCYLDGATKDRLGECRRFNGDARIPVFLISLHAGGTGLNLTGADTVVHFDPWWNPAVEDQATDRAHRIGQKKTVCVVKFITEGSVEERVLKLQERKQQVIAATIGATDAAVVRALTFDDLREVAGI